MSRAVAVIDADANLLKELSNELTTVGLAAETFVDANDLLARTDHVPDLVVLCIDPKRTGWAVCNRLRKSPAHKSVPLIITSAEASEKDFEDHRKLKTRAEDYLQKPFVARDLVRRVASLLGHELPGDDDVAIDSDAIAIEEDVVLEDAAHELLDLDNESTRIGMRFDEVTQDADKAFAASQEEQTQRGSKQQMQQLAQEAQRAPEPASLATAPSPITGVIKVPEAPTSGLAAELGLDAVAKQAAEEPVRQRRSSSPYPIGANTPGVDAAKYEAQLAELRQERDRLQSELADARRAPPAPVAPSGSMSREKEFLSLREVINKKEKEILDLRESIDARDRQILDGKDRLREADRKVRDFDDKQLELERELMAEREKLEELQNAQRGAADREAQLKQRFEELQRNAQAQLEAATQKHARDLQARDHEHQQQLTAHAQKHAEELAHWKAQAQNDAAAAEARRLGELASLEGRRARELALADERRLQELTSAEEQRARDLTELEKKHQGDVTALQERHRADTAALEQKLREEAQLDKAQELAVLEARRTQEAAQLEKQRTADIERAVQEARAEVETQAQLREQELSGELELIKSELAQARAATEAAKAEAQKKIDETMGRLTREGDQKVKAEVDRLTADHGNKLAEERRNFETQMALVAQGHAQKLEEIEAEHAGNRAAKEAEHGAEIEELEGKVEAANQQLKQARDTAVQQSTQITELETRVSDLAAREAELQKRMAELEKATEQVAANTAAADRARRALAVAVALLDQIAPESEKSG